MDFGFCSLLLSQIHQSLNMCWKTKAYASIRKEDNDWEVIILIQMHKQRKSGSDLEVKKKKKRIVGGLWNKSGLCGFGFVWATDVTLCPK